MQRGECWVVALQGGSGEARCQHGAVLEESHESASAYSADRQSIEHGRAICQVRLPRTRWIAPKKITRRACRTLGRIERMERIQVVVEEPGLTAGVDQIGGD